MKKYIVIGLVFLLVSSLRAEMNKNVGTCVGQFLEIGVGARPTGMGEAFCAVADDINAIYWNPAGLMQIKGKEVTFMHNEWLYDLKYEFLAYCQPTKVGMCAFSLTYLRMGELEGKDKDDNPIGNFTAYDYALSIAYAVPANENVYVGITGKFIQQKIEKEKTSGIAIDIGMLYLDPSRKGFKVGAVLQNLGSKLKFVQKSESLPFAYKIGVSYKNDKFTFAGDITNPEDNDIRVNLGIEYVPVSILTLRIGYNSQNDLDLGFSFGAGFRLKSSQIDYAFTPYGELDNAHRFSLTTRF